MRKKLPILFFLLVFVIVIIIIPFAAYINQAPNDSSASVVTGCGTSNTYKFIDQTLPAKLNLGQAFTFGFALQNCSNENWLTTNYKFQIIDNGQSIVPAKSINLTDNIAKAGKQTVNLSFTAPTKKGVYTFELALTKAGQIVKPEFPAFSIVVGDPTLCNLDAFNGNGTDASSALQACINNAATGDMIAIKDGNYTVSKQIAITKPISLISYTQMSNHNRCTESYLTPCVRFIANSTFPNSSYSTVADGAIVKISNGQVDRANWLSGVSFRDIIIDGNRYARTKLSNCAATTQDLRLYNIYSETNNSSFFYGGSLRAACGSGFVLEGKGNIVAWNYIGENGVNTADRQWSDGLSIDAEGSKVINNEFKNNTDVDLIIWRGKDGTFANNEIIHDSSQNQSYAAIMLNTFGNAPAANVQYLADFTNSYTGYNKISCGIAGCGFGIEIGEGPWFNSSIHIFGGLVEKNSIDGAVQGINIDGAGTAQTGQQVLLYANSITNSGGYTFSCNGQTIKTGKINIAQGNYPYFVEGKDLSDTSYKWRCLLPTCKNYSSLCKNIASQATSLYGKVYCQSTTGEIIPMSNVSIQVVSGTDRKSYSATTNASGDFTVPVGNRSYQSYSVNAVIPPNQSSKSSTNVQTKTYSQFVQTGSYCSSWAGACLNATCNSKGGYEGCILDPGQNKGPFIFAFSNCF